MLRENVALALEALKANKMRSFLTMLGIIIGISSVIAIITIGNALTASIAKELQVFGSSNVMVNVLERSEIGRDMGDDSGSMNRPDDDDLITDEMIEAVQLKYADQIEGVALNYSTGSATAKDGRLYANVSVTGVNYDYLAVSSLKMDTGRFISDQDVSAYRNVAVVSDRFVVNMYGDGQDPIGQEIKVYGTESIDVYTIVGTYIYETSMFSADHTGAEVDRQTDLYIPVSTAKQSTDYSNYNNLTIKLRDDVDPLVFTPKIEAYFKDLYANNVTWDVSAENFSSMIDTINSTLGLVSVAISAIAGISLLVGGIGVMNIMLVSVTERTMEIGIRKALGAKNFHVRFQFVIEAGIVSLIGGALGIALGLGLGWLVSLVIGTPVSVSPMVILLSLGFSTAIGLFFGYYPANKAALLDPIDALRYN